jgi:triacylglycerol esterase/lipase EstA (alpha/beta hydrolase family)
MRMTTIIVHGALAKGATWYASSWEARGFCQAFAAGMSDHDIWLAHGEPVGHYDKLNPKKKWSLWTGTRGILQTVEGPYEWTGSWEGLARGGAAVWLAAYLNALRSVTDEPIRIVAHSQGCNVVKLASMLPDLD